MGSRSEALAASGQVVIEAADYLQTDIQSNTTTARKNVRLTSEKGRIEADFLTYNAESGLVNASGAVKLTTPDGMIIQAEQLVYNVNTEDAQFSGGVQIKAYDEMVFTAERLDYHGNSGWIKASGGVKFTTGEADFQTDTLDYNLKDLNGSSGAVRITTGSVDNGTLERKLIVVGDSMEIIHGVSHIKDAKVTRCQKPKPDYLFTATETIYDGQQIKLKNIILRVKGVPCFYYPVLNLDVEGNNFPELRPGYDPNAGLLLGYKYWIPVNKDMRWRVSGQLQSHDNFSGSSNIKLGIESSKGNISNYGGVSYNFQGFWGIEDQLTHDTPLLKTTIDGLREYNSISKSELGFSMTRKYWGSPVGRWQFGILGRKVSALDGYVEYGGIYGGYRLDYNPHPWVTLSLLRLYSFAGGDYRGFLSDFHLGSNWLYNVGIPLNRMYSLSLYGTYNSDDPKWIHRVVQINRETDCFAASVGWDDAANSWLWGVTIKF